MFRFDRQTWLFFIINALACIGLNIGVVGVNWFIIEATRQNMMLGLYSAVSLLSAFLMLVFGGELTDRYAKMRILRFCCIGQAVLFFLTAACVRSGMPVLWIIGGLAVLNMPLMVLFSTASRGAVAFVWPEEKLNKGNAVLEVTLQIGAMCAALLTGFLYHRWGFEWLMVMGGVLTAAAGGVLCWPHPWPDSLPAERKNYWQELRGGIYYLCRHRRCAWYGLAAFIPTILIFVSNTVVTGFVQQVVGKNALVYGVAEVCFAVGALLAGIAGGRLMSRSGEKKGYYLFAGIVAALCGLMYNRATGLFFVLIFTAGVLLAGLRIGLNTLFMKHTEPTFIGRCLSLLMAVSMVLQALFSLAAGRLMDVCGAASGYWVLIGLALCGGGFLWLGAEAQNK